MPEEEISIVPYKPCYHAAFRRLNEEWITAHFEMEESDYRILDDPEGSILGKGGFIYMALYGSEPVGTCSLLKMEGEGRAYELAKMAVSPAHQGKRIGYLLGKAIVAQAGKLGAERIYLESNTRLQPAVRLYERLGFKTIPGRQAAYKRCDIQMELLFVREDGCS